MLLNLCTKFNQTANACEFVLLDCARQGRPTVLVVWIYACTSADQRENHVQRAILRCEVNRRLLLVFFALELHVRVHTVVEVERRLLLIIVLYLLNESLKTITSE